jgi:hypothetical protein
MKKGDTVKVVKFISPVSATTRQMLGKEYVIEEVDNISAIINGSYHFPLEELELVKEETK